MNALFKNTHGMQNISHQWLLIVLQEQKKIMCNIKHKLNYFKNQNEWKQICLWTKIRILNARTAIVFIIY